MDQGLLTSQVIQQQKKFGRNEITAQESFSIITLFLSQFPTIINAILAIGGIFSFVIHEPLDGFFIFAILILNAILGFVQEFRAEQALQKLKNLSQPTCIVIREGKAQEIQAIDVVPEDIVLLNEGDRIPADGIIQSATHIEIDESILTGESIPVAKKHADEVFQGTFVATGKGHMRVTTIGSQTRLGQISQTLADVEETTTPLQKQITQLARILSFGALGIAILLVPIGIMHGKALYPILLLAISIGVAAIPESLPAVITISLAIGTSRMAAKKALVRKLASIETIGAVQIVLTDKTGTLTQNNMRVKESFLQKKALFHDLLHACIVGNTAHISQDTKTPEVIGDKTDGALLLWAHEQDTKAYTETDVTILDEFTFDPTTKTITTVASIHTKPLVIVRGAPESVLSMCTLTQKEKDSLQKQYETYASHGLRVIAFAQKHEPHHTKFSRKELETQMTFLGFLGLYDPPRPEAAQAVKDAHAAGIRVIMVTGDNPLTAQAIAQEVGISTKGASVLTGKDIDTYTDQQLEEALQHTSVYARTTPENKLRLVTLLESQGYIVGVTGDGVNDALALKKANVGLSMGQKGTDVAKEASDIVLADDNFATLVDAVKEGRKIYANIVKAIMYLIAGNLAELGLIFVATIFNTAIPLLPTQILWINLVTDGLPALALASEKSTYGQMHAKPRKQEEPIITKQRMIFISLSASILIAILFISFIVTNELLGIEKARTIVFNGMVFLQMILAIIIRGKQSFWSNKFFLITLLLTIIFQVILTTHPILQDIFHLTI